MSDTDHDLEDLLERHLGARARHLDLPDGALTAVGPRARRHRRTRNVARVGLSALACLAVVVGVTTFDGGDETSVDTVEQPGVVEGTIPAPEVASRGDGVDWQAWFTVFDGRSYAIAYGEAGGATLLASGGGEWTTVALPGAAPDELTLTASDDHLLALGRVDDEAVAYVSDDGTTWTATALAPNPDGSQQASSSATHLFATLETPDEGTRTRMAAEAVLQETIDERFPDHTGHGASYGPGQDPVIEVFVDDETVFRGSLEELGVDPDEVAVIYDEEPFGPGMDRTVLASRDGTTWSPVTLPDADPAELSIRVSNAGLLVASSTTAWISQDGVSFDELTGVGAPAEVGSVRRTPLGVFASDFTSVRRADTLAGPWERIDLGPAEAAFGDRSGGSLDLVVGVDSVAIVVTRFPDDGSRDAGDGSTETTIASSIDDTGFLTAVFEVERDGFVLRLSLESGGELVRPDGSVIALAPEQLDGQGDAVRMEGTDVSTLVFLDPDTGEDLVAFTVTELLGALADQHPEFDDEITALLEGRSETSSGEATFETGSETFSEQGTALRTTTTVLVSTDGRTFRTVDLPDDPAVFGRGVVPRPDGTYLLMGSDETGARIETRVIDPRA